MFLSPDKCSFVLFGLKDELQTDHVSNNVTIKNSKKKKIFQADNKLDFSLHLTSIINKKKIKLNNLVRVQKYMTPGQRTFLTSSFIKSLNLTTVI